MQLFIDLLADIVAVVGIGAILIYAPLAKSSMRAILTVFLIFLLWGVIRIIASCVFKSEPDAPLIGFLVAPFMYTLFAALVRGIALLLFRLPFFTKSKTKERNL